MSPSHLYNETNISCCSRWFLLFMNMLLSVFYSFVHLYVNVFILNRLIHYDSLYVYIYTHCIHLLCIHTFMGFRGFMQYVCLRVCIRIYALLIYDHSCIHSFISFHFISFHFISFHFISFHFISSIRPYIHPCSH